MPANELVVATPVSDDSILMNCLARSPDVIHGRIRLLELRNHTTCGKAFNRVLRETDAEAVVFAHQDVYLPEGFAGKLTMRISEIEDFDSDWAILGLLGVTPRGEIAGKVWSTAWGKVFEGDTELPTEIVSADELLIVVRVRPPLHFDEELPNFHLYATDIIQSGLAVGRRSYAIDAAVIHHDKPVIALGADYRKAYRYLQKKWASRLPIPHLIVPISTSRFDIHLKDFHVRAARGWATERVVPRDNPALLARALDWE